MGPNQTYKLLHSKGNYKQNEKTTNRLRENIYKWCNQQGLNPKYTNSYNSTTKKANNPIEKLAKYQNKHFFSKE